MKPQGEPPVIGIKLSGHRLFSAWIHAAISGDQLSDCEWRPGALVFRNRNGETLVPLSNISAFWLLQEKMPIYEVQLKTQDVAEWRFVFVLASQHYFGSLVIPDLRQAIRASNPEASIVPPPGKPGWRVRTGNLYP